MAGRTFRVAKKRTKRTPTTIDGEPILAGAINEAGDVAGKIYQPDTGLGNSETVGDVAEENIGTGDSQTVNHSEFEPVRIGKRRGRKPKSEIHAAVSETVAPEIVGGIDFVCELAGMGFDEDERKRFIRAVENLLQHYPSVPFLNSKKMAWLKLAGVSAMILGTRVIAFKKMHDSKEEKTS